MSRVLFEMSNLFRVFVMLEIAKALGRSSSLASLDLSWNGLGEDGAKALLDALADNTSLASLNIASNRIDDSGTTSKMLARVWPTYSKAPFQSICTGISIRLFGFCILFTCVLVFLLLT